METIKNAFMAPFSTTAAKETTPFKIAIAYTAAGLLLGMLLTDRPV